MAEKPAEIDVDKVKAMSLTERLYEIMASLPPMKKTKHAKFGNYNYVPHDAVTNEIRKMLVRYRIMAYPSVTKVVRESGLTLVEVDIALVSVDAAADSRVLHGAGMCALENDKSYGAALSYAIKYAYLKLFHVETGEMDTDDNMDDKVYNPSEMGDYLFEFFEKMKYDPEKIRGVWNNNGKDWKVVEERARKTEADAKKKKGK